MPEANFDDLALDARDAHNKIGEHNIWKAAMALPQWHFIAQGEGDDLQPMFGQVDGHAHVIVFTDSDRAEAFARHIAEKSGKEAPGTLFMDVPDAVAYFQSLIEHNIAGALFNNGKYSFQDSLTNIIDMYRRYD